MAESARGTVKLSIIADRNNSTNLSGALRAEALLDRLYKLGDATADLQFNRVFDAMVTVPSASFVDLNLQTQATDPDATINADGLVVLFVDAPLTNTGIVTMEPSAVDGWTALMQTGSVLNLQPGTCLPLLSTQQYAVLVANRQIRFSTAEGTDQAISVVVLAASN